MHLTVLNELPENAILRPKSAEQITGKLSHYERNPSLSKYHNTQQAVSKLKSKVHIGR